MLSLCKLNIYLQLCEIRIAVERKLVNQNENIRLYLCVVRQFIVASASRVKLSAAHEFNTGIIHLT